MPCELERLAIGVAGVHASGTFMCPDGTSCPNSQVCKCGGCAAVPPYGPHCSCECGVLTADPFPASDDDVAQLAAAVLVELADVRTYGAPELRSDQADVRRWYTPTYETKSCCTSCALAGPCTGGDE